MDILICRIVIRDTDNGTEHPVLVGAFTHTAMCRTESERVVTYLEKLAKERDMEDVYEFETKITLLLLDAPADLTEVREQLES